MSALLIDLPTPDLAPRPWVHVEPGSRPAAPRAPQRSPQGRPRALAAPGGRPAGVRPPEVRSAPVVRRPQGMQLTRRGLAVVVGFFLALMVTSAVVLVGSFLSVSNDPVEPAQSAQVLRS